MDRPLIVVLLLGNFVINLAWMMRETNLLIFSLMVLLLSKLTVQIFYHIYLLCMLPWKGNTMALFFGHLSKLQPMWICVACIIYLFSFYDSNVLFNYLLSSATDWAIHTYYCPGWHYNNWKKSGLLNGAITRFATWFYTMLMPLCNVRNQILK